MSKKTNNKSVSPLKKNAIIWGQFGGQIGLTLLGLIIVVIIYGTLIEKEAKIEEVSLSTLAQAVEAGNISKIIVSGEDLKVTTVAGVEQKAKKEADSSLSETLVNYGVSGSRLSSVDVTIEKETGFKFWFLNLLPFLVPVLFLVLFF